ncbi:MAG: tyrosine-type recombinase/integrase [Clostridia bacterium]|nr:tyrosine-type recombinase/integrase [Clostridia bacterium]
MPNNDYFAQRDSFNLRKLYDILDNMPSFCREYFVGIESSTTVLTRLNYAYDLRLFFYYLTTEQTPHAGKLIKDITLHDIETLASYEIEKYLSYLSYYENSEGKNQINSEKGKARKLSSLRAFIKFFLAKEYITRDPTVVIRKPKIKDKEIIRLEHSEVEDLIEVAENGTGMSEHQQNYHKNTAIRDTALVSLMLGTGIRISELVGLDIDDINFADSSFVITRKGGNRVQLYFNQEVGGLLYEYYELRLHNQRVDKSEKALFLSLQNTRLTTRAIQNIVKKYSHLVTPLKRITPHKLRSTFGTELYKNTGDIYVVADVLGHKDVNTTKKHYAAISDNIRRNASKKVVLRQEITESDDDTLK